MKNSFISILSLFFLLLTLPARSQSCLPNGITFSTQAEVDNFPLDYPGCTAIEGNVLIRGTDITDLSALSVLNSISGAGGLEINDNPSLASLHGLENISALSGNLIVVGNVVMTSLSGLDNLTTVGGSVSVDNEAMPDLNGLNSLTTIGERLTLGGGALESLNGLESLATIGEQLGINYTTLLTDLSGLDNLQSVGEISLFSNYGLVSLHGLENLTTVTGSIGLFNNYELADLSGLGSLTSLQGFVLSNCGTTDLAGFGSGLTELEFLFIYDNYYLTSLSGLDSIMAITDYVAIQNNYMLQSLHGLESLATIGADFLIAENQSLVSLDGLESLTTIGDSLAIINNPGLKDLRGLKNLKEIAHSLRIGQNYSLMSLAGLDNLQSVGGMLVVTDNPSLSDCAVRPVCDHLENQPGQVMIANNAPGCEGMEAVQADCHANRLQVVVLLDNNHSCEPDPTDTPLEGVLVSLSDVAPVYLGATDSSGVARFKYFEHQNYSVTLPQLSPAHWAACENPITSPIIESLDTFKIYFLLSPLDNCPELSVELGLPSEFRSCLATSEIEALATNTGTVNAENVEVALVMPPTLELLASSPLPIAQSGDTLFFEAGDLSPLASAAVQMTVKTTCNIFNFGQTLCLEAFADMQNPCPDILPPLSEIKLAAQCIGDTTVRFTLKNIGDAPTQSPHYYVILRNGDIWGQANFNLAAQQSMLVEAPADGATYRMEATKFDDGTLTATAIENCGGLTPGLINAFWLDQGPLNYDFDCREVIGSFDPNQKTAVPAGLGASHAIVPNRPLEYTIDFQNTGSDTAFRVLLRDVLPPYLDVSTFRPGFGSHPYTWKIRTDTLEVLFFPIMLPDSNVNEPASHGFFSFTIDQKPDLPDGTILENTASIIFDFNPPIVTNTVLHTIKKLLIVEVDEPQKQEALWQVLGNPTQDVAIFQAEAFIAGSKRFELYDAAGRMVRSARFEEQQFEFHRDGLPAGLYFFRIADAQARVCMGKIVVVE